MKKPVRLRVVTTWGTVAVDCLDDRPTACRLPLLKETPQQAFAVTRQDNHPAALFVCAVLEGRSAKTPDFDLPDGTPFQHMVWQHIAGIPRGTTLSYGELAAEIGRPTACRAVAGACGRNPLPLFIPCHRVMAAGGGLGGFSAGTTWKKQLLSSEI